MAKMNSLSLYVTTNQIALKSDPKNPSSWQDLYRLVPYLRNTLCCIVCGNLLMDPLTPGSGKCQHHLCQKCKGGRKKIKPSCAWCKDCNYVENKMLRILLQCYKKMCIMLINSKIFCGIMEQVGKSATAAGVERGAGNLIMLIREGAEFQDDYEAANVGLSKSAYSILPCIYTKTNNQQSIYNNSSNQHSIYSANSNTQQCIYGNANNQPDRGQSMLLNSSLRTVSNNAHPQLYSVMYTGTGSKITIKRKPKESAETKTLKSNNTQVLNEMSDKGVFKKPNQKCGGTKLRRGCRCGNATATPGKLTCCGQRCPCYVEGKACLECKCRGCRNPHLPDGNKMVPNLLQQQQPQQHQHQVPIRQPLVHANVIMPQLNDHFNASDLGNPYGKVNTPLPHELILNEYRYRNADEEDLIVDM